VHATPRRCYEDFIDWTAQERRDADEQGDTVKDQRAKLSSNGSYGQTLMNVNKFMKMMPTMDGRVLDKEINSSKYTGHDVFEGATSERHVYLISKHYQSHKQSIPIQVGLAVLQLSKVRMLEYVYDFLFKFLDRNSIQLMKMDTDSIVFAFHSVDAEALELVRQYRQPITEEEEAEAKAFVDAKAARTGQPPKGKAVKKRLEAVRLRPLQHLIDTLVRPEMREEYLTVRDRFLLRWDIEEHYNYDLRTPGKFKAENLFYEFAAPTVKTDFAYVIPEEEIEARKGAKKGEAPKDEAPKGKCTELDVSKLTLKGVQKKRNEAHIRMDDFRRCIYDSEAKKFENVGFRVVDGHQTTYEVNKVGLSPLYDKMYLLDATVCAPYL
jgi:hypothetical protein